jgi:hypothetical protein
MLKEAFEYLVGLKQNKTYEIGGKTYSGEELVLIEEPKDAPQSINISTISSVVTLIKREQKHFVAPTFIKILSPRELSIQSSYDTDNKYKRYEYYRVKCDAPMFAPQWYEREDMIIHLMSLFDSTADLDYVLDLISTISSNSTIETTDNGITQKVTARQGVELKQSIAIKPIVSLKPFRTFLEVEQPESKFLLRVGERIKIGLLEADGGKWILDAKKNIAAYFEENLPELIQAGGIVVVS